MCSGINDSTVDRIIVIILETDDSCLDPHSVTVSALFLTLHRYSIIWFHDTLTQSDYTRVLPDREIPPTFCGINAVRHLRNPAESLLMKTQVMCSGHKYRQRLH